MNCKSPNPPNIPDGETKNRVAAALEYFQKLPPAISGRGGNHQTFLAAVAAVRKFGLEELEATAVLAKWNQRCKPPWSESELLQKIRFVASTRTTGDFAVTTNSTAMGGQSMPAKPKKFQPMVLRRIALKTRSIRDIYKFLEQNSSKATDSLDPVGVLSALYPKGTGEKILIFSNMKSQGQLIWRADDGEATQNKQLPSGQDGVWFLPQPITGDYHPNPRLDYKKSRRSEEAVTAFRYAVLESDTAEAEDWLRCLIQLPMRIESICESGGRSTHALVRVDATSKSDWDTKLLSIKPLLVTLGADPHALTAVRLTRLPQAWRGDRQQRLLYLNPQAGGQPIFQGKTN